MAKRKERTTASGFVRRRILGMVLNPYAANPDQAVPRPARLAMGLVIVTALALGVSGVVGGGSPRAQTDWRHGLIADASGAQYVMIDGRLHPVLNMTSAHLILGPTPVRTVQSDKVLNPLKQGQGPTVGVPQAPDQLPAAGSVDLKDWSVCVTAAGRTVVEIGYRPASSAMVINAPAGLLALDEAGTSWIVDGGVRYRLADRSLLTALAPTDLKPRRVSSAWLAGLPAGDAMEIPKFVGTFGAREPRPAPAGFDRVGMFGRSILSDGGQAFYIVTANGLTVVSPIMYRLYHYEPRLALYHFTERVLSKGAVTADMLAPAAQFLNWPGEVPNFSSAYQDAAKAASGVLCAAFGGVFDQQGRPHMQVSLASALPQEASASTRVEAGAGGVVVLVRPGHAAIVRDSGSDPATATEYLIADTGSRYELVGTASAKLGYDGVASAEVPADWIKLVAAGPALDPAKAVLPASPGAVPPVPQSSSTTVPAPH